MAQTSDSGFKSWLYKKKKYVCAKNSQTLQSLRLKDVQSLSHSTPSFQDGENEIQILDDSLKITHQDERRDGIEPNSFTLISLFESGLQICPESKSLHVL